MSSEGGKNDSKTNNVKRSNSNTSKRRKKQKKGGQFKRQKERHWKGTHRAGVKCCEKNVIRLKIQYGGASRNAVPFFPSLDLSLQFCHVTESPLTSSNERAVSNS